jgi:hypothetical protein
MMNSLDDESTTDDLQGLIVLGEAPESDEDEVVTSREDNGFKRRLESEPVGGLGSPSLARFRLDPNISFE